MSRRDKLRKGKQREGTPEKPTTPNASTGELGEDGQPLLEKNIIINEEILALQIKPDDLEKIRQPKPPSEERKKSPTACSVVVRKLKPASEWDRPKPKIVTVAKPAPPDAPLKPYDYSEGAGPRFDDEGQVVSHSILGSIEDFKKTAAAMGDLPAEMTVPRPDSQQGHLSVKYEKDKPKGFPKFRSVEESNALKNWQKTMYERKRQQGYLSKLLNKPEEQLVMNQADSYRKTQELRYIIDRTIAFKDYGKGYRIGSEFWKQQEQMGDELTGLHMTLSQTEKGYPPPIEHVFVPDTVKKEKGIAWTAPRSPFHKPWHRTPYLAERKAQLQPMIDELDPHLPADCGLEVVGRSRPWSGRRPWTGSSRLEDRPASKQEMRTPTPAPTQSSYDPLASHPDVHPEPIFGPSIQFAGQPARWTGDSTSFDGQVGIEARVTFEAYAGKRTTSFLEIVNDGTTSIYYDWKKVPKTNPFDMANPKTQRFYFNTSGGVILPGDTMKFPFVFKSPNAGVFSEQWQFQTSPTVCGGAALVVTLRGVSLQEDKYQQQRSQIEENLSNKQAEQVVSCILGDILEGIKTPERPSSPIDAYITEEEIFRRKNPNLMYDSETVSRLKLTHKELFPEEEREDQEWDLSVENLKMLLMNLEEIEEEAGEEGGGGGAGARKQELLHFVNQSVCAISFPQFSPKQTQMQISGYEVMCTLVDNIVGSAMELRHSLGMPERDDGDIPEEPSDGKKGNAGGGKPGSKNEAASKKGGKDSKSGGKGKETGKGGKSTPGKRPNTREKGERPPSGGQIASGQQSPVAASASDPILEAKYKEKLFSQSYDLVAESIDNMSAVFIGIEDAEGGRALPKLI